MIILTVDRMRNMTKRLRKVLRVLGVDLKHAACLDLAARLCGFDHWEHYLISHGDEPLSLLDDELSDADFEARDVFQMTVLEASGLGNVARELLDRANPTGSWARHATEEPAREPAVGNSHFDAWLLEHKNR